MYCPSSSYTVFILKSSQALIQLTIQEEKENIQREEGVYGKNAIEFRMEFSLSFFLVSKSEGDEEGISFSCLLAPGTRLEARDSVYHLNPVDCFFSTCFISSMISYLPEVFSPTHDSVFRLTFGIRTMMTSVSFTQSDDCCFDLCLYSCLLHSCLPHT